MSECKLVKLVLHFSVAAYRGHQKVVKQLLTTDGVDPFTKNFKGETLLSLAAGNGHEDMVRLLLKVEGSDPDTKDFLGETPLCWAAGNGHETVVKLLLVTGVDIAFCPTRMIDEIFREGSLVGSWGYIHVA